MTPEELDASIELLLEGRPNEEKPKRRRRNKYKDLVKRARRYDTIISDRIIEDLLGDVFTEEISYVRVRYETGELYLGDFDGWYDDLNELADSIGVESHKLRLEKGMAYNTELDDYTWEATRVYQKALFLLTEYCGDDDRIITRGRVFRLGRFQPLVVAKEWQGELLEEGVHEYTEEVRKVIANMTGKDAPKRLYHKKYNRDLHDIRYNERVFREYDKYNKYPEYAKAMREYDNARLYSETIPIQKGNPLGAKIKLIRCINGASSEELSKALSLEGEEHLSDELYRLAEEYEDAFDAIVYEYVW